MAVDIPIDWKQIGGLVYNKLSKRREEAIGRTGGHGFVSRPDLELVKVRSAVLALLTSDYADGICVRVNRQ